MIQTHTSYMHMHNIANERGNIIAKQQNCFCFSLSLSPLLEYNCLPPKSSKNPLPNHLDFQSPQGVMKE